MEVEFAKGVFEARVGLPTRRANFEPGWLRGVARSHPIMSSGGRFGGNGWLTCDVGGYKRDRQ